MGHLHLGLPRFIGGQGILHGARPFRKAILTDKDIKLTLNGPTIVGRVSYPTEDDPQIIAAKYHGAEYSVAIRGNYSVSLNHAVLAFESGSWKVFDLGSKNGSFINGRRVSTFNMALSDGDELAFGNRKFKFELETAPEQNIALLVGNSSEGENYLSGVRNDLLLLKMALKARACFTEIHVLFKQEATRGAILRFIEERSAVLDGNSLFMFYFSGHGNEYGIDTYDAGMLPQNLYPALERMPGNKLLLLDCCNSSVFLRGLPKKTALMGAEDDKGNAREVELQAPPDGIDGLVIELSDQSLSQLKFRRGCLTYAFIDAIDGHRQGRPNFHIVAERMKSHRALVSAGQELFSDLQTTIYI